MKAIIDGAGPPKTSSHVTMLAFEAMFAAAINTVMSCLVIWVKYHDVVLVPVWGMSGVMFNTFPTSVIPTGAMTIAGTLALRKRLANGESRGEQAPSSGFVARLPAGLIARAIVLAVCTALVVAAVTFLGVKRTGVTTLSFSALMATQIIQAILIGLVVGPAIVIRTLHEPHLTLSEG